MHRVWNEYTTYYYCIVCGPGSGHLWHWCSPDTTANKPQTDVPHINTGKSVQNQVRASYQTYLSLQQIHIRSYSVGTIVFMLQQASYTYGQLRSGRHGEMLLLFFNIFVVVVTCFFLKGTYRPLSTSVVRGCVGHTSQTRHYYCYSTTS